MEKSTACPHLRCVTLGKLLDLSVPQLVYLLNGIPSVIVLAPEGLREK